MTINPIIIGNCKLFHGDIREILPSMGQCAHLVCTDPPYPLTTGGTPEGGLHERLGGHGYDNSGHIVPCDISWSEFMPLLYGTLKPNTHAYVMCNNRHVQNMLVNAEAAGFDFHNLLVWDKGTATPNRWYMKNCEFVGFFYKKPAKAINDCGAKQLINCPQVDVSGQFDSEDRSHPTEKPVALMRHYIEQSTQRGEIVLDPFMGSGSTGVAAIQSGRQFIGIEKDERYFDMAVSRIISAVENFQERLL